MKEFSYQNVVNAQKYPINAQQTNALSKSALKTFKSDTQNISLDISLVLVLVTLNIIYLLFHCFYCFERVFV